MKSVLGQGQVQATNGLAANGGILGAAVNMYAKRKDYEMKYAYNTALMDYQHANDKELAIHKAATNLTTNIASSAIQNHFDTLFEATKTKEAKKRIGAQTAGNIAQQRDLHAQLRETDAQKVKGQRGLQNNAGRIARKNAEHFTGENAKRVETETGADIAKKYAAEDATQGTIAARAAQDRKNANNAARLSRKNKAHGIETDIQGMRDQSAGLNDGTISPFVVKPGQNQSAGNRRVGVEDINPVKASQNKPEAPFEAKGATADAPKPAKVRKPRPPKQAGGQP